MKMQTLEVDTHSRGIQEKRAYKIAQNAKVMDMLSNRLYADKIKAVVRELSTNAWDAHVVAGNTNKVPDVYLPTSQNCEFRLRDYGTGMSVEQLEEMYLTYGESDKTHTDDLNGCMGIGSKSPFAYARAFTTTSYHNGMKHVYINAKDENNMPELQYLGSTPTSEPNGLEVSVAVDRKDISSFQSKAESVLKWFPKPFNVHGGNGNFSVSKREYSFEGNGWKVRSDTNTSCAIMGYVEYPIEQEHFFDSKEQQEENIKKYGNDWYQHYDWAVQKYRNRHVELLNLGLELHFDIGQVEMDISREGLQYTPKTIRHIKSLLNRVLDEIGDQVSKKFDAATCLWDARCLYYQLSHGELRNVSKLLSISNIKWNGKELKSHNVNVNEKDFPKGIELKKFYKTYGNHRREDQVDTIYANGKAVFYETNLDRGNYVACQRAIDNDGHETVYLVSFDNDAAKQAFCDYVGILPKHINKCSSVPKPPKSKRKKVENVFLFNNNNAVSRYGRNRLSEYWTADTVDFKAGGLWVELNSWKTKPASKKDDGYGFNGDDIKSLIDILAELGITTPDIAGIKSVSAKKYDKSKNWECFFAWAKRQIDDHVKSAKIEDHLAAINALSKCDDADNFLDLVKRSNTSLKKSDSPMKKLVDKLENLATIKKKWGTKINQIREACRLSGVDFPATKESNELDDLVKEVKDKYQVLSLVSSYSWGYNDRATILIDMINLVDAEAST